MGSPWAAHVRSPCAGSRARERGALLRIVLALKTIASELGTPLATGDDNRRSSNVSTPAQGRRPNGQRASRWVRRHAAPNHLERGVCAVSVLDRPTPSARRRHDHLSGQQDRTTATRPLRTQCATARHVMGQSRSTRVACNRTAPVASAGNVSALDEKPAARQRQSRGAHDVARIRAALRALRSNSGAGAHDAPPLSLTCGSADMTNAPRMLDSPALPARPAQAGGHVNGDGPVLDLLRRGKVSAAIEVLFKVEGEAVYAFCRRIVRDDAQAEDVRQKVFLQAYQGMSRFAGESSLRTWLLGIAKFRSLDALRVQHREQGHATFDEAPPVDAMASGAAPADEIERDRLQRMLEACLVRCVSAEDRRLLHLHYHEGLSFEEMGARLGRKPDTLRARVARALPRLRRCLLRQGVTL
jgi:RNA polymerase sigma-70 factor, ECF subfamily